MPTVTESTDSDRLTPSPTIPLVEFTCERCGFIYNKQFDFPPFLCYRCMRFIAKRTYTTMQTITPLGRTEREDI